MLTSVPVLKLIQDNAVNASHVPTEPANFEVNDHDEKNKPDLFSPLFNVSRSITSAFIEFGNAAKPPAAKPVVMVIGNIHQKSPSPKRR